MAGPPLLWKPSDVLIASCSCVDATDGHWTFQMSIQHFLKGAWVSWNGAHRKSGCTKLFPQILKVGKLLDIRHIAGPLQFKKVFAILIASCSSVDGIAGHHTLQVNVYNVSKACTLLVHSKGTLINSCSTTLWWSGCLANMAGPLQLRVSKTSDVLIASCSYVDATIGSLRIPNDHSTFLKSAHVSWNGAHRKSGKWLDIGRLAGPLQFIKVFTILIASCSSVDCIAGHQTLQVNV
jgi:hypothetical protein